MIIIYIDIILLVILLCLTVFTCAYCFYRVYSLQRAGQVTVLLRPTRVLFSHKKDGGTTEELRTVVAYQNPFTGDYCVHAPRAPRGYENRLPSPLHSPDSGLSDEYEPLHVDVAVPRVDSLELPDGPLLPKREDILVKPPLVPKRNEDADNTVSKTWNWNYTEYQI